jgi:hypothetical protein
MLILIVKDIAYITILILFNNIVKIAPLVHIRTALPFGELLYPFQSQL